MSRTSRLKTLRVRSSFLVFVTKSGANLRASRRNLIRKRSCGATENDEVIPMLRRAVGNLSRAHYLRASSRSR
jgi:hypothetical protein